MADFRFVVEGPPVSVNAKDKQPKKYQRWKLTVRDAARRVWSSTRPPSDSPTYFVSVTNYYRITKDRPHPPDVDNILKPVLDGMESVVYGDDNKVAIVTSDRFDLGDGLTGAIADLSVAVAQFSEFLYVQVVWKEE